MGQEIVTIVQEFETATMLVVFKEGGWRTVFRITQELLEDSCYPLPNPLTKDALRDWMEFSSKPRFHVVDIDGAFYPNDPEGIHI